MTIPFPVLVLSGTVGAGKTSVGRAASRLLTLRRIPHALIDLDWMETFWTSSKDDDDAEITLHRNVAALWTNYRAAGCERLIFCRIVETCAHVQQCATPADIATHVISVADRTPTQLARSVLDVAGWLD